MIFLSERKLLSLDEDTVTEAESFDKVESMEESDESDV